MSGTGFIEQISENFQSVPNAVPNSNKIGIPKRGLKKFATAI
jgi:hypothetical protein